MRIAPLALLVALALAAGADAKAPPSGVQLCGTNGCATIGAQAAEQLFAPGGTPPAPARRAPFFRLRWTFDDGRTQQGGYWLPDQDLLDLGGWVTPGAGATSLLAAAASGLQPFALTPPASVRVGNRWAADPASYARLLDEGSRVSTWVGARDWIPVKLASPDPTPWTDGSFDLRISRAAGFVWREGAVYRIPLALARLARAGRSLAPTPAPSGFAALGAAGCAPASPRRANDAFGTATATQLWARFTLPAGASWASTPDATLGGAVGRSVRIELRLGGKSVRAAAAGPDGARIQPGPHGYAFPQPGCWRIHAGDGVVAGDLWLDVAS